MHKIDLSGKGIHVIDRLKHNPFFEKSAAAQITALNLEKNYITKLECLT